MLVPPGGGHSLEGRNQLGNGVSGQHGRFGARCRGLIGACNWDVAELTGDEFHLAMTDMTWQVRDAGKLENSTIERMSGVGDRDLAFAFLCHQRGITLAVVCQHREDRILTRSLHLLGNVRGQLPDQTLVHRRLQREIEPLEGPHAGEMGDLQPHPDPLALLGIDLALQGLGRGIPGRSTPPWPPPRAPPAASREDESIADASRRVNTRSSTGSRSMLMAGPLPRSRCRPTAAAPPGSVAAGSPDRRGCRLRAVQALEMRRVADPRTRLERPLVAGDPRPPEPDLDAARPHDHLDGARGRGGAARCIASCRYPQNSRHSRVESGVGSAPPAAAPATAATPGVRHARNERSVVRWSCRESVGRRPRRSTAPGAVCKASNAANDRPARALCLT